MKRRLLITVGAVVILGGTVAGLLLARGSTPEKPKAKSPPATAEVTRATLVETKTVSGRLGYGDPVPASAAGSGTLTWIAPVGSTVARGKALFKVDERPVVVLYGSLPLYRRLQVGAKGADVQELEQNLADSGYAGFTVDDTYTEATAAAVRTWQAKLGVPRSGTVAPGQAVVTPGAVRIAEHTARVGDMVGGSRDGGAAVLSYTGTARLVTVDLKVADLALAVKGATVTLTVPGAGAVEGKISETGTIATAAQGDASAAAGNASAPDAGSAASDATIPVTIAVANQQALGSLAAAPVDVALVSAERKAVLAVPVSALLALTQGGFGVEIVDGDTTRIVAVKTGMFASGRVEVSGAGIAEGVKVGVPK